MFGFALAYSGLVFHLYGLQLTKGEYYFAQAASQAVLDAPRGLIYFVDKTGTRVPAVSNKEFPQIYAVPKAIEDVQETVQALSGILGLPPEDLEKKLSKKDSTYELLEKKTSFEIAGRVGDLKMKGVYVDAASDRFYPFGRIAAHVLGYVGPNKNDLSEGGHYGLEEYYQAELAGKKGSQEGGKVVPPEAGENIVLTIDTNIQAEAEKILAQALADHRAKGGSVIVEDPKTGKILAMGSVPNFDPNAYSDARIADFLNPATQKVYEPGSVFKVITMAAGIDAGKITPDTKFYDTGSLKLNGKEIKNWDLKAHGTVTMTQVIEKSLNTGAAFAQRQTGDAIFRSYVAKFGFGEKTGIDAPGEVSGNVRVMEKKDAPPIAFAAASFGQGISVTPLGIINAIAAIANGGTLMRPYVNSELGQKEIRRVISADTARAVTGMMTSAVDKAEVAKIKGYAIAGKTGTAQVPDFVRGGYTEQVNHTYIGFGPTSNPRFIILLKLNEPEGAPLAGTTVVPAFRDLAQFILNYYNVAPDRAE
ncbi:MAG: hypothetical protein A2946_00555 [Candidatus Liptonbacteria bacterium RIFCSPLOWO2_01_FULL_53_13]|uniref:Penicillin-binding protein transpeptidase domain-containing protein n=1 Tax=Candidatus Liptonbacteria bacterium RIFCSPLOWO2_01_FULL_53_13 TaxID=1798651 RepID=A0A1G2CGF1_9BACT|nr:MAG: hypothetical protein A2946_00555 [Candidatus Liptonbacteria bacterium RIFCSPLOWO2_01_FULL_53_13]